MTAWGRHYSLDTRYRLVRPNQLKRPCLLTAIHGLLRSLCSCTFVKDCQQVILSFVHCLDVSLCCPSGRLGGVFAFRETRGR